MILLFLTAGFLSYTFAGILLFINKKEILYNQRVVQFFEEPAKKDSKKTSTKKSMAINNLVSKYWERGTNYLNKKVSKEERRKIDTLLRDAGYPFKTAVDFRLFQFVLSAVIVMPILFFMLPAVENKMNIWLLALSGALLGFRLPVFYLGKKKTARIKLINKMMPDFFDTVNLLLKAGMGLDLAIAEVSKKIKGPISEEFIQTLEDMKLGKSRREAFYELRKRVPSDTFQSIITSIIQADQLGIGMAKVLSSLTVRIREQRKEAAREQAMKAPVKMLFPMVFFIFPSLFIVILGPLIIFFVTKGLGG